MNPEVVAALRAKAEEIRNELVCCDVYDRVQEWTNREDVRLSWSRFDYPGLHVPHYHAICHWGEAAARIVEHGLPGVLERDS